MLEALVASLDDKEREAVLGRGEGPLGVVVTSERGLCGAFNNRFVVEGLRQLPQLAWHGGPVRVLCLGSRGRRIPEASGQELLYAKPLPSLSVPSYGEIEAIALDLLDLIAGGAFKQLWVIYNAPVRRFQYTFVARRLLPLDMAPGGPRPARVKPAGQTRRILTHLLSEELVGLYQTALDSGISEQLARMAHDAACNGQL